MRSFLLSVASCVAGATAAHATDFLVTRTADDGAGSLRAAIEAANASPGPDRVVFDDALAGLAVEIAGPAPTITEVVDLVGPRGAPVVLRSNGGDRVLRIATTAGEQVWLWQLQFEGGRHPERGGCVEILRARVLMHRVRATDCEAGYGGAIAVGEGASLELADSRVDHNSARSRGAGIASRGALHVLDSEIDHNTVAAGGFVTGGGIDFSADDAGSPLWILNSRLHHNAALFTPGAEPDSTSAGGAVNAVRGAVAIRQSSFYANRALYGAALNRSGGVDDTVQAEIVNSTFARNEGRKPVAILSGNAAIAHSTIAGNLVAEDTPYTGGAIDAWASASLRLDHVVSAGNFPSGSGYDVASGGRPVVAEHNAIGRFAAGAFDAGHSGSNLLGVEPRLGGLHWNGGATPTMRPLPGSPLVDAGSRDGAGLPPTDQRGAARWTGVAVDLGAFEEDGDRLFGDSFDPGPAD